jgi:hypothetical protein
MWLGVVVEEGQASAGAAFPYGPAAARLSQCLAGVVNSSPRPPVNLHSSSSGSVFFSCFFFLSVSVPSSSKTYATWPSAGPVRSGSPSRRPGCRRAAFLPQTRPVALSCWSSQCLDRRAKDGPCLPMATCYQLPSQCDPLLTRPTDHPNARLARQPLFASGRRSLFGLRPPSDDAPTRPPPPFGRDISLGRVLASLSLTCVALGQSRLLHSSPSRRQPRGRSQPQTGRTSRRPAQHAFPADAFPTAGTESSSPARPLPPRRLGPRLCISGGGPRPGPRTRFRRRAPSEREPELAR